MISNHEFSLISVAVLHNSFSPFTFFYLTLYFSLLLFLFCCDSFITFWLVIEFITLLLIGVCFSVFTNSYSYLIIYFLTQSISSFSLLLFYVVDYYYLFIVFLLVKLSMFPFHSWYINVVYRFPPFPLFLVSTLHKIPSFIIIPLFIIPLTSLLYILLPMTIFVASFYMFSSSDFRMLLVSSSVGNNSWFLLSSLVSIDFIILYVLIYSLNFYFLLLSFSPLSSVSYGFSSTFQPLSFNLWLIAISGMPPFPVFFMKAYILYVLSSFIPISSLFCLFFTFLIVSAYVISLFNILAFRYTSMVSMVY